MPDLVQDNPSAKGAAERRGALDGVTGPISAPGPTLVTILSPCARAVLRGGDDARAAFGAALGLTLPTAVGRVAESDSRAVMCLGPDEWLAVAPLEDPAFAALCEGEAPGCAVDVSHRQLALSVTGPFAGTLLNAGCPLDLHASAFPPGACTRTVCGKAEIVVWRRAIDRFHVETARSFAAYLWAFLEQAAMGLPPIPALMSG
ncbi:MAG TPA: sarcosine oxidase subunit gamma family protein [Acidisphaera sp.]|nr:sarcosine oxidase subunit gamma family protein [Acidisphaera sp.]